jgi:hypothetical protein
MKGFMILNQLKSDVFKRIVEDEKEAIKNDSSILCEDYESMLSEHGEDTDDVINSSIKSIDPENIKFRPSGTWYIPPVLVVSSLYQAKKEIQRTELEAIFKDYLDFAVVIGDDLELGIENLIDDFIEPLDYKVFNLGDVKLYLRLLLRNMRINIIENISSIGIDDTSFNIEFSKLYIDYSIKNLRNVELKKWFYNTYWEQVVSIPRKEIKGELEREEAFKKVIKPPVRTGTTNNHSLELGVLFQYFINSGYLRSDSVMNYRKLLAKLVGGKPSTFKKSLKKKGNYAQFSIKNVESIKLIFKGFYSIAQKDSYDDSDVPQIIVKLLKALVEYGIIEPSVNFETEVMPIILNPYNSNKLNEIKINSFLYKMLDDLKSKVSKT